MKNSISRYVRIVIQLPAEVKHELDALRNEGYTASGFIRALLERELAIRRADQTDEKSLSPNNTMAGALHHGVDIR